MLWGCKNFGLKDLKFGFVRIYGKKLGDFIDLKGFFIDIIVYYFKLIFSFV